MAACYLCQATVGKEGQLLCVDCADLPNRLKQAEADVATLRAALQEVLQAKVWPGLEGNALYALQVVAEKALASTGRRPGGDGR